MAEETKVEKVLAPNEVKLSDGRVVRLREQKGSDELAVAKELGEVFTADASGGVVYMNALIAKTVISIDDKPQAPIRGYLPLLDFMDDFKGKDWRKVTELYQKLNGDDDENAKKK